MTLGTGQLFQEEAKQRFTRLTGQRYDALEKRLIKKGLPVQFSKKEFREHVLAALGGTYDGFVSCRYCKGLFNIEDIAADHEIPLSRGGSLDISNIGFTCHLDNDRKGSLTPDEYLTLLHFLELEIPLGRQDILSRLGKAVALAQGARSNAATIQALKESGAWQEAQKARRAARKAKEEPF